MSRPLVNLSNTMLRHRDARIGIFSLLLLMLLCCCRPAAAAEVIPPAPSQYVTDNAGVLSPATVAALNTQLDKFERDTSNQIVVALYPHMQSDDDIAAYTTRIFHAWKIGQKGKNNGAALFVFTQDHKMQIITGYGLEGALPDITCKRIIDNEIAPRFKAGDWDGGVRNGVNAMIAATRGEYKGTGQTVADQHQNGNGASALVPWIFIIAIVLFIIIGSRRGWGGGGWGGGGMLYGGGGFGTGGGGWGGFGGGGGFSGGGFSGGGGDTGGGGAGGSW